MSRYPVWIQKLYRDVIDRDRALCINDRRPAWDVHHIIPRRGKKWNKKIWRKENMCCICRDCHNDGQTVWMRVQLLQRMRVLYGYDMSWAIPEVGLVTVLED